MIPSMKRRFAAMNPWRPGPMWAAIVSGGNLAFGVILLFSGGGPGYIIAGAFMLLTALAVRLCTREQASAPDDEGSDLRATAQSRHTTSTT